ncbi:AlwI family type II restriction endonuclease [Rufibacter quisquiliarum]|uniref:AlwI restriction endonuclease n=1 Tax=Rufibacter quisquiliarum TaxID=1549639 RepID=A0A839GIJ1_9BACT|nr:AlwI family type II restriction endonuclease [Rufibacter quisquiliarum]MBA9076549.1 hypothetical protein [Rufibacter quisquiliarum]
MIALASSALQGNLRGRDQEIAFMNLLGEKGVVTLRGDVTYSVGRKWRSALEKLGFIYPEVSREINQTDLGLLDAITPNGRRLIQAEPVPAIQECFLRSLAAFYIPSPVESGYDFAPFSPLRHTLSILLELERITGESRLNFIEMAVVVQLSNSNQPITEIVEQILALRQARLDSSSKRRFDQQEKAKAAEIHNYAANTFSDYADTNFRYLKATGLIQTKGRGISIVPERRVFIEKLILDQAVPENELNYLKNITNGASLPTDNIETGLEVLKDLIDQVRSKGIEFSPPDITLTTAADVSNIRHEVEDQLFKLKEKEFADQQVAHWEEIVGYMDLIITRRKSLTLANETEIEVPQAEAPAYFEWVLWRAFLAIDSLVNAPYEARRFKIDQDFLPVGTAPGGGPDLIFEFEDFVIVGEVTLTDNSRQEAAEGEPVRRHVADLVSRYPNKSVYGLFMANKIDSNTAETFRIGVWYASNDERMTLDIIPLTLKQFRDFFVAIFTSGRINVNHVLELLKSCTTLRGENEAPVWKAQINEIITEKVLALSSY